MQDGIDVSTRRLEIKLQRELGPDILAALADPLVVEIMLNPDGQIWVEKMGQGMATVGTMTATAAECLMGTIADGLKTVVTREKPILEGELPGDPEKFKGAGSRFEGLLPPLVARPSFTLRKKASAIFSLQKYVDDGVMTEQQRLQIIEAVKTRQNILVVGGTSSGKTTFLNAVIACIVDVTPEHRLVIIEDTAEIQCSAKNTTPLRTSENCDMQRLLRATMRLRPDRILVGEVRGGEALALLKAWNTGHPGGFATVHANSALAGLIRMEQLVAEGSTSPMETLIAEAVNMVVFIEKDSTCRAGRRVKQMIRITGYDAPTKQYRFTEL